MKLPAKHPAKRPVKRKGYDMGGVVQGVSNVAGSVGRNMAAAQSRQDAADAAQAARVRQDTADRAESARKQGALAEEGRAARVAVQKTNDEIKAVGTPGYGVARQTSQIASDALSRAGTAYDGKTHYTTFPTDNPEGYPAPGMARGGKVKKVVPIKRKR